MKLLEKGNVRSGWLRRAGRRAVRLAAATLVLLVLLAAGPVHHVYFDRSGLPDLESFLRFEPPTIGEIYDDRGRVLIELAREYRRVVSYDEVPPILRDAVLAAEDKNFFSHSGVEYRALPRVVQKTARHSLAAMVERRWAPADLSPGWLHDHATARPQLLPPGSDPPREQRPPHRRRLGRAGRLGSAGRSSHEQAATEDGGGAPDAVARGGDAPALRIEGSRPSARSSPAMPASSTWATVATASPPPRSTTSASPCRASPRRTEGRRPRWREPSSRRRSTPRCPATRDPCAAATRFWP